MPAATALRAEDYYSAEDYAFILLLKGLSGLTDTERTEFALALSELATYLDASDPDGFESALERDMALTYRRYEDADFRRLVRLGLEYGTAAGSAACANFLGGLYYTGDVVERDYRRAKELFEFAEAKGIVQATINLGYIYEYGRLGTPDHISAYLQYAKAAAAFSHTEALYKLGDMYLRDTAVKRDPRCAYALYRRSIELAQGARQLAQPAIRIAKMISDPDYAEFDIPYSPLGALELFQLAERGLRISIAEGDLYYRPRLAEAIEGQERMRRLLDDPSICL